MDNHSSRRQITLPLKQPTRTLDGPPIEFLFGLATSGVYLAARCYQRHGVLLPHPFTLTVFTAVCSLLHWSSAHAARTLSPTQPILAPAVLAGNCAPRSCGHADGREKKTDCLTNSRRSIGGIQRAVKFSFLFLITSVRIALQNTVIFNRTFIIRISYELFTNRTRNTFC